MHKETIPAGWYDDPYNTDTLRYWDGTNWTSFTYPPQSQVPDISTSDGPGEIVPDLKRWGIGDAITGMAIFFGLNLFGGVIIFAFLKAFEVWNPPTEQQYLKDFLLNFATIDFLSMVVGATSLVVAFFGYPWLVSKTKGSGSLRKDFGLSFRWLDVPIGITAGLLTLMLAGVIGYAYQFVTQSTPQGNASQNSDTMSLSVFVVTILTVAVLAPICEEIFFRGLLYQSIAKKYRTFSAVIVSSIIFGFMHSITGGTIWFVIITTTVFGLCFAVLVVYTKRLGAAIIAHATLNSIVILSTVLAAT